ncbi:MAG: VOC family protein [Alphaproteobacteria bacterium]
MLTHTQPMAFLGTTKPEESRSFYEDTLGLEFVEDGPFALVFNLNGTPLRIQKIEALAPPQHTNLGWVVDDIAAKVDALAARGVTFARYDHMEQDARGIWTTPSGAKVVWFYDPCGNNLSLTQEP